MGWTLSACMNADSPARRAVASGSPVRRMHAVDANLRKGRNLQAGSSAAPRPVIVVADGEGHREAHPPALAHLIPHGGAAARHRPGDPPRRRGLQRHERGRLRPPVLRRPRRARLAGHPAHGRQAGSTASPSRRTTRCGRRTSTCPPIAFTDEELAALQFALSLLDGEFAYAEPLRLALQQISWGRPEPAQRPRPAARVALGITASAGGHELSAAPGEDRDGDLPPQDDHVRLLHDGARRRSAPRKVDPYHLLFQGGQFYLLGHSHERERAPRLPPLADPRQGRLRHEGRARLQAPGRLRPARRTPTAPTGSSASRSAPPRSGSPSASPGRSSATSAASATVAPGRRRRRSSSHRRTRTLRQLAAWALRARRARARRGPDGARAPRSPSASSCSPSATTASPSSPPPSRRAPPTPRRPRPSRDGRARDGAIRPERFARLVTLASILIEAGRAGERLRSDDVCERAAGLRRRAARGRQRPQRRELRRRLLCALRRGPRRRHDRGRPRALLRQLRPPRAAAAGRGQGARRRDRPHRRAPARGRADLRAREDRRRARRRPDGAGPAGRRRRRRRLRDRARRLARHRRDRRLLRLEYYKPNEDEFSERDDRALRAHQRPRGLVRRVVRPGARRRPPLPPGPRQGRAEVLDERSSRGPRSTRPPTSTAGRAPARSRPRASPASGSRPSAPAGRARSAASRGARRRLGRRRAAFKGTDWLVREVLAEAGDAAVLEPAEAREAVRAAVGRLRRGRALTRVPLAFPACPGATRSTMSDAEVLAFLDEERACLRDERPARLAAPDAALVRGDRRRRTRSGRGRSPSRRRRATSSATRGRPCRSRRARPTTSCAA